MQTNTFVVQSFTSYTSWPIGWIMHKLQTLITIVYNCVQANMLTNNQSLQFDALADVLNQAMTKKK